MVREEGPSALFRGVTPNVFRAVLMNASQLASSVLLSSSFSLFRRTHVRGRYDYFKAELIKSGKFEDNLKCHFTASFMAVRLLSTHTQSLDALY